MNYHTRLNTDTLDHIRIIKLYTLVYNFSIDLAFGAFVFETDKGAVVLWVFPSFTTQFQQCAHLLMRMSY